MVKKKEDVPEWVSNEIQSAKFEKPISVTKSGYILEIYKEDEKIAAQLYEPADVEVE